MTIGCVIARRVDTWPILNAQYRGACRGLWWPLSNEADPEARALTAARDREVLSVPPSELRAGASTDLDYLRTYLDVCERLELDCLFGFICRALEAAVSHHGWVQHVLSASSWLGVDVIYGSGSFSFINAASGSKDPVLQAALQTSLNQNGLFDTFDEAQRFVRIYQSALDRGVNLEVLDDAMPVELWQDQELKALRRAFER